MSLKILVKDELFGFYKSNVMLILLIGMPIFSVIMFLFTPSSKEMPFSLMFASIISGIGGTLSSMMLAVYIIHEKNKNVFELFLIRPIKRYQLLLAKYIAVFVCVISALLISLIFGVAGDLIKNGFIADKVINSTFDTLLMCLASISMACSGGIFVGVISDKVLVGIILILFVTNYMTSFTLLLPNILSLPHPLLITCAAAVVITVLLLTASIQIFKRIEF